MSHSQSPILDESETTEVHTAHDSKCETPITKVIIEPEEESVMKSRDWWNRTCDVFGAREAAYINELRPIRKNLIRMQEAMKIFQYELERDLETEHSSKYCYKHVKECILHLNRVCGRSTLNIPPSENEMIRAIAYELALLARIIQEVASMARSHEIVHRAGVAPVDEESLKNKLTTIIDVVENFLKYIDKKTERRWWLKDLISFTHALVRIALFVSAAISVAYHKNQIAPIVTLVITCIQGITEGLDQFFVRHKNGNQIQISLIGPKHSNKLH